MARPKKAVPKKVEVAQEEVKQPKKTQTSPNKPSEQKISSVKLLHIIYLTFAIGVAFGVIPFLGWIVSFIPIAGVMLAHIKRSEASEPWLISHFDWQIKTFWVTFAASIVGYFTLPLFGFGIIILIARSVWGIYRVVKGWLALYENREIKPINWLL